MGLFDFFADRSGHTYEDVQRRRALAEALQARAAGAAPQTFGAGLASLGAALGGVMADRRYDKAEGLRVEEANKRFAAALGAPQPAAGFTVPGYEPSLGPGMALASSAPSQPTFNPDGSIGRDLLVQGLVQRGLPEHVAQGFAMNAADESGFNPGINEIAPTVPGSRGGFGLMQWTGPRRVALEGFAAQMGRPVSDPNLQMDFLVNELQGPEKAAAQSILSAPDTGSAAAAIVNDFLRPAAEHRERRVAEYTGGAGFSGGGMAPITVQAPAVNTQLLAAMSDPFLDPQQKQMLGMLFQSQQAAQMTPYQQAQLAMQGQQHALQMQQAAQPDPLSWDTRELPNGAVVQVNPQTGETREVVPSSGQAGFRSATAEEAAAYGAAGGQFGPDGRFYPVNPPSGFAVETGPDGQVRVIQGAGAGAAAGKPFTEAQSKDVVFATRAKGALEAFEPYGDAMTSRRDRIAEGVPLGLGRETQSPEFQMAKNAGDEFLQAILRKDTGAAITAQEQTLYGQTYLPHPGDGPEVLEYKRAARQRAVAALEAGMSPAQMLAQEKALAGGTPQAPAAPSAPATTYTFNPETGELE